MMTDYIKRTDAVKIAEKYGLANGSVLGRHTGLADCIARDISGLPAADVAEVVRCRDCKYGEVDDADFPAQYLCKHNGADWNDENHFCSYGEQKEGAA